MEHAAEPSGRTSAGRRAPLLAAAPLAVAIGVFGVLFGAAASAELGATFAIAMSLLVFSGAVQFAVVGLLASGAGTAAILVTVVALNARSVVMGAVLRPRIGGSTLRRAGLSAFLVDESFGLAIAASRPAVVLAVTGVTFYLAWQVGTVLGVIGASAVALEDLAVAVFPVLFIGLAAVTVGGRTGALRAAVAAGAVAVLAWLAPGLHAFLPMLAAVAVALPGRRR